LIFVRLHAHHWKLLATYSFILGLELSLVMVLGVRATRHLALVGAILQAPYIPPPPANAAPLATENGCAGATAPRRQPRAARASAPMITRTRQSTMPPMRAGIGTEGFNVDVETSHLRSTAPRLARELICVVSLLVLLLS
jgi:hypothetical protein